MIDNNLCFDIALYPYELVTYGETGQVCQNWMQYRLIKKYLEELTEEQTLVIESASSRIVSFKPDAPTGDYHELQRWWECSITKRIGMSPPRWESLIMDR